MPDHVDVDESHIEELYKGGGLKNATLARRQRVGQDFKNFVQEKLSVSAEDLLGGDKGPLEDAVTKFFMGLRVSQRQEDGSTESIVPKRNTLEFFRSMLKQFILMETNSTVDITSATVFPKFTQCFKGLIKEVKSHGRGETQHHKPLDKVSLEKIYQIGADVAGVFEAKLSNGDVSAAVGKLPDQYKGSYHYLLQMIVQFVLTLFDVRRGQEGLDMLTKQHFKKEKYLAGGYDVYRKVLGESSKNHKLDGENLEDCGIIPCVSNNGGFNPGRILEIYLEFLHPENPFLFQRPRRPGKNFNIDTDSQLFEPTKVGRNLVSPMMKNLCKLLDLPAYTNHSIRATGIVLLKESGFGDREICRVSGHKAIGSLEHYDPSNSIEKKAEMASALLNLKRPAAPISKDEDKENYQIAPMKKKIVVEDGVIVQQGSSTSEPALILLHREQQLRMKEQDMRQKDQDMQRSMMNHIMEMNKVLVSKLDQN